jgi:hypothetical protein
MAAPEGEPGPAPAGAAVRLEVVDGPGQGQVFPLPRGRALDVGRGRGVDVSLWRDLAISRRHFEARWNGCRVWVRDLDSASGTVVQTPSDGPRAYIEREGRFLRLGVVFRAGGSRFRFGSRLRVEAAWLAWGGGVAGKMAKAIDAEGRYADLPVLADALEEAGCDDRALLDHCRSGGEHVRGCWVIDWLLGEAKP